MSEEMGYSTAFVRICNLAEAEGAVPEDGSGIDGTWQTSVEDPDTGEYWYVGVNADVDDEHDVDLGDPHGEVSVPAGRAVVFYADFFGPVAMLGPMDGTFLVDGRALEDQSEGTFDRRTEDQLIHTLESAIEERDTDE